MGILDFLIPKSDKYTLSAFQCERDNLTIRGLMRRPAGVDLPVAIVCHGFMANQRSVQQYCHALALNGYIALSFDFCGGCLLGGKSDGATTDMSVLTEVEDLVAVINYAKNLPYSNGSVLIMGCSQGGFVCGLTAAKYPELVDKLVLFYPAINIPDDARAGQMQMAKFDPQNVPETFRCGFMKLGHQYAEDVRDINSFDILKAYEGHVLITHGTNDEIVPVDYSKRLVKTYKNAKLVLIGNGDHGYKKKHDIVAIQHLLKFSAE